MGGESRSRAIVNQVRGGREFHEQYRRDPVARGIAIHLLLDYGPDVNARQMDHGTALHLASCLGHFEVVKDLLEVLNGESNIHERDDEGQTPFKLAVVLSI